ncbi:MAG: N-acetyltransferase family protein [Limisphaerales bacterium]
MTKITDFSVVETLRDGRNITIRALKPEDRTAMLSAVGRISPKSLYRRFFGSKRGFSEEETNFFVNVDFVTHVALAAVIDESGKKTIIGAGRYIVTQPGKAELAFAIIDDYQGLGIGTALLRNLVVIARESGLQQLVAEVLPENAPMLALFRKCGFGAKKNSGAGVVHMVLDLLQATTSSSEEHIKNI